MPDYPGYMEGSLPADRGGPATNSQQRLENISHYYENTGSVMSLIHFEMLSRAGLIINSHRLPEAIQMPLPLEP